MGGGGGEGGCPTYQQEPRVSFHDNTCTLNIISCRSMFSASMTDAGTTSLQNSISEEIVDVTATSKSELPAEERGT